MAEILAMRRIEPEGPVIAEQSGGILRLTLANPPANALSMAAMAALQAELDRARDDTSVRVLVLAAHGKVFSGGHDLKEMTAHRADHDGGKGFFDQTFAACSRMMQSIVALPKPVIAVVDGIATAAGCQLVATCDLAIASDKATFGVNGIDVGLFCTTPGVALARGLKPKHAMEMLLTGEMVDASTAREFGLVNRVVPREYLTQIVSKYAQTIATKSPSALKVGKEAFYAQAQMSLADAYDYASRVMVENMLACDAKEGIGAFIEKRKPVWE
ncbi:MAG: enoyl-CoA hydratase [Rhizobiaceae bacterium]